MRIITGSARGTKLEAPEGYETTRPTAEMVKEAVFSIIQFDIAGKSVLDLFAGSGQMGLEALSRGADNAVFVDRDRAAIKVITSNAEKTHLQDRSKIIASDYAAYIRLNPDERFDIVFIDPPYASDNSFTAVKKLLENDMLLDNAFVIIERGDDKTYDAGGVELIRHRKYGKSYIAVYRKVSEK